jgi:Xaa-Pro aminopeptidase
VRDTDTDIGPTENAVRSERLERARRLVRTGLRKRDAGAFVHAADDGDGTYLGAPAAVLTADRAVLLRTADGGPRPPTPTPDAEVRTVDDPPGAVARVARELTAGTETTVLTPRSVRHDAALFLEEAGFEVASTTALGTARARKTPAEREAVRRLGTATATGIDAVRRELAAATVRDGRLHLDDAGDARDAGSGGGHETDGDDGDETGDSDASGDDKDGDSDSDALTASSLTKHLRVALARGGVDAGDSRVWSVEGGGAALVAGRPVVVACRPVGPDGTRLHAATTVVVDGDGGWERRASLALDHAHRAGRQQLDAALDGDPETAGSVEAEIRAELAAYGFETSTVAVHGVGCSGREAPQGGDDVEAGQVVVVSATVERTDDETTTEARRADLVTRAETLLLGADGDVERLVSLPTSLTPSAGAR